MTTVTTGLSTNRHPGGGQRHGTTVGQQTQNCVMRKINKCLFGKTFAQAYEYLFRGLFPPLCCAVLAGTPLPLIHYTIERSSCSLNSADKMCASQARPSEEKETTRRSHPPWTSCCPGCDSPNYQLSRLPAYLSFYVSLGVSGQWTSKCPKRKPTNLSDCYDDATRVPLR